MRCTRRRATSRRRTKPAWTGCSSPKATNPLWKTRSVPMTGNQFRFPANTTPTRQATAVTTYASSASPTPPTRSRPAGPAPSRCFSSNGTATHAPQPWATSAPAPPPDHTPATHPAFWPPSTTSSSASSTAPDTPTTPAPDVNSAGTAPAAYAPLNSSDCNPNNTMLLAPQDQDFDLSPGEPPSQVCLYGTAAGHRVSAPTPL